MNQNLEVCTFNLKDFNKAIKYNISRIELCANKDVGGVSPEKEDIIYATSKGISIFPIVRPRPGNFSYSNKEIQNMINYISFCKEYGCKGIVFGILNSENGIDISNCKKLIKESEGMSKTFHMAFDLAKDSFISMEKIIDLGFDRILTSGKETSAIKGKDLIKELAIKGHNRISVMPGLKLRSDNIDIFIRDENIYEYHSSCYINNSFSESELTRIIKKVSN